MFRAGDIPDPDRLSAGGDGRLLVYSAVVVRWVSRRTDNQMVRLALHRGWARQGELNRYKARPSACILFPARYLTWLCWLTRRDWASFVGLSPRGVFLSCFRLLSGGGGTVLKRAYPSIM